MGGVVLKINAQPVSLALGARKVVLEIGGSRGPAGLGLPVSDYIANSGLLQASGPSELYGFFDVPWLDIDDTAVTLTAADARPLRFLSDDPVTVTVPTGLGEKFQAVIWQKGAGLITFANGAGVTNGTRTGANQSAGQGAVFGLAVVEDGVTATFVLAGDVG